ncbi:hypothetical protein CGCA056_v009534 [Colletotrichum aenigma]|uniref:uncharacterized protein n=1 Tax=Colletotrichum aenigma TaxID=1215731 RepID=UPI00187328D7|nr:uncharacterized protein CGCA056_v009534 [Colletotrichum aenigma]KAF5518716.1 hypothetical protein CGCA056_v009534 [Colletotrichum aenigma]
MRKPIPQFNFSPMGCEIYVGEICLTYVNFRDFKKTSSHRDITTAPNPYQIDIPDMIVDNTIQSLIPNSHGRIVANLIKIPFRKQKSVFNMDQEAQHTNPWHSSVPTDLTTTRDHPFLCYAKANWLQHTRNISSASNAWGLWERMVIEDHAPWVDYDWHPLEIPVFDYDTHIPADHPCHIVFSGAEEGRRWLALHKAIAYANMLEHHPLLDKLVSIFVEDNLLIETEILETLIQVKPVRQLLPDDETENNGIDVHGCLVNLVTQILARGGELWPKPQANRSLLNRPISTCGEWCAHHNWKGIHMDVCQVLRGEAMYSSRIMRIFAQVSNTTLTDETFQKLKSEFRQGDRESRRLIVISRTVRGKSIVDLVIERGGRPSATITQWILEQCKRISRDDIKQITRAGILHAFKTRNSHALSVLVDFTAQTLPVLLPKVDEELLDRALGQSWLPIDLRRRVMSYFIPPVGLEDLEERRVRRNLLLKSIKLWEWDFALALHKSGACLADNPEAKGKNTAVEKSEISCEEDTYWCWDSLLSCAANKGTDIRGSCAITNDANREVRGLVYCEDHRNWGYRILDGHSATKVQTSGSTQESLSGLLRASLENW